MAPTNPAQRGNTPQRRDMMQLPAVRCGAASTVFALVFLALLVLTGGRSVANPLDGGRTAGVLSNDSSFLRVDEAFVLSGRRGDDGAVLVRWDIADGYYLYRHAFSFDPHPDTPDTADLLEDAEIPPGLAKHDEFFGDVEVYYGDARVRVPLAAPAEFDGDLVVRVSYQGCADAGLCYPPERRWLRFEEGQNEAVVLAAAPDDTATARDTAPAAALDSSAGSSTGGVPGTIGAPGTVDAPITGFGSGFGDDSQLAAFLSRSSLPAALALFFLAGVGLALTPCVLPMVPILSSIIVGQGPQITQLRAFTLSLAYVLGMAVTYAIIGTLMGLFGAGMNVQAALQAPVVLFVFAGVFVLLALSMFGFYELRLPRAWQERVDAASQQQQGGRYASVAVMGALSSLVVSPCISAPLAGALIYISLSGDAMIGGAVLLALALGMGAPLLVLGATGGQLLPKAGPWMDAIKAVFGVGLLAVAIWLLERVLPGPATLLLWGSLAVVCGVYLGALDFSPRQGWNQFWKATGSVTFIYGVLLLIGSATGAVNPLQPLERLASGSLPVTSAAALDWRPVKGLPGLESELAAAAQQGRPIMLEMHADWCISCQRIKRNVFPAPEVASRLAQMTLLQTDVTANDAADQALAQAFGLFGPPTFLFFSADGEELSRFRIQGEVSRERFAAHLDQLLRMHGNDNNSDIGGA